MNNAKEVVDFLTQANYDFNRRLGETPERLKLVFKNTIKLEKNYAKSIRHRPSQLLPSCKSGE